MAPWTRRNYLAGLRKALAWAKAEGLLPEVPRAPKVKVPRKRPQPVAEAGFDRLLSEAPTPQWRAFLLCAWLAGLRLSEAHQLRRAWSDRWPWADLGQSRLVLPARFAKADEDQWVPLPSALRGALALVPDDGSGRYFAFPRRGGGELAPGSLSPAVKRMARRAGVALGMHTLRKGFGCKVARKAPAAVLHRLMRHSTMQVTMDFYASVDDALHGFVEAL
jgi:integrase